MGSLRQRLQDIADALASDAELARAAGVSRSAVHQWLNGPKEPQMLDADTALNIEDETGFSARWIVFGKEPKKINTAAESRPTSGSTRNIPSEAERLLAVLKTFLETDEHGKGAIWGAAKLTRKRRAKDPSPPKVPSPTHRR